MYAHCLFCNAGLGRNEALEAFPVGRRLAYDADKGRLWVVCSACGRWNLTPLEQRWEAIEQAERLYRGTRLRASTDNVGLARVADGVDLVRVGKPLLPEFAGWRYGAQLTKRRLRHVARAAPAAVVGGAGVIATVAAYLYAPGFTGPAGVVGTIGASYAIGAVGQLFGHAEAATKRAMLGDATTVAGRVSPVPDLPSGARYVVRRGHLAESTLRGDRDGDLVLDLRHDAGRAQFRGATARQIAALLSPTLNPTGAGATVLDEVVRSVSVRGGPEGYLAAMAMWVQKATRPMAGAPARWTADAVVPDSGLYALMPVQRLALEVVLHDDLERRAMDGELADLERAWREAEEIAAIADDLALPRAVETAWAQLRTRVGRGEAGRR